MILLPLPLSPVIIGMHLHTWLDITFTTVVAHMGPLSSPWHSNHVKLWKLNKTATLIDSSQDSLFHIHYISP
jgi:hypothetical protein